MQQVLKHLRERQQTFARSSFIGFLRDVRLSPQERLSFLPCVAPLVLGFADLNRALMGEEPELIPENPQESAHWALYLSDLQMLGLSSASDLNGMLRLLWGAEGSFTRKLLFELIDLAANASPALTQVLMLALHSAGSMGLGALEHVSRTFEVRTGKELVGLRFLRAQLDGASSWVSAARELPPGSEKDALETIDEVFTRLTDLSNHLLAYALHQLEVKRALVAWEPPSTLTFEEFGIARLQALCEAVGYDASDTETVKRFFSFMSSPWGSRQISHTPPWKSDITDDHTPFELSLALEDGRPEVRFLIEAQSAHGPTTLRSTWEDGLALTERLGQEFGVRLERFNLVKDLFEPVDPRARFALWHAFFLKNGRADIKVYFNPSAQGPERANAVVQEALERLGLHGAWRCLSEQALRPDGQDQIIYFSLDLSAHRAARVKIYLAHRNITAEELESVMSLAHEYAPGEAWVFCQALKGHTGRVESSRSLLTCLSFTSDDDERPASVTLHVPVRCHVRNDAETMERIRFLLEPQSFSLLERATHTLAHRRLDRGVGLIQWTSMRRQNGKTRTTCYLATEAYGLQAERGDGLQPPAYLRDTAPALSRVTI
jgi:DMATS type aromatic prenyltransferase